MPRGEKHKSVDALFHVNPKMAPREFRHIICTRSRAHFPTCSPPHSVAPAEDRARMQRCVQKNGVRLAEECFWSILARGKNLALRHSHLLKGNLFLSGSAISGPAILGLPLSEKNSHHIVYFTTGKVTSHYYMSIVSMDEWVCRCLEWTSPLWLRITTGRWLREHVLVLHQFGEPDTLIKVYTMPVFYAIPKTALCNIGTEVGASTDPALDANDNLRILAEVVLGALTVEQSVALLRMRMNKVRMTWRHTCFLTVQPVWSLIQLMKTSMRDWVQLSVTRLSVKHVCIKINPL